MSENKVNVFDPNREAELREAIEDFFFGYRAFTALPDRLLAERGLGRTHHRILHFVRRDDGLSIGELLDILGITKQALHRPIKDLEGQGLIAIAPDVNDRRVRRLTITDDGRTLEAELTAAQMRLLDDVFRQAGSGAETSWRAVMELLRADPLDQDARALSTFTTTAAHAPISGG
ncbi:MULTISPECIES: MarR family winged helix-turn-helix transcriptional regulator [unclassified Rhodococcus (in: high G+C Gram-positive bacteria)]|uniref:MarR family winged helix-turn-helix transcriptional regulator n=1 Tax=unclassified Rhodococcus (in: high G+C Gram-positive bacteria) TaxID=192944 RepID=UPI00146EE9AD|nr:MULTISPECIES: MarR family transcriptional regulator [unclassified Rhodococcus (in: high G+C Gram-positive bacteria)]NLU63896.1 MarR family transcriptional regulator [Rhodococcus sp. HNM0563]